MNKNGSETGELPFFVTGMRGKLGNRVYYMRNGEIRSRRHVMPSNPRTGKQRERRSRFAGAVKEWRGLDADLRTPWNRRARGMKMSGYNLFMRESMSRTAGVGVTYPRHMREFLAFCFHMPAPCMGTSRLSFAKKKVAQRKSRLKRRRGLAPLLLKLTLQGPVKDIRVCTGPPSTSCLGFLFFSLRVRQSCFFTTNNSPFTE